MNSRNAKTDTNLSLVRTQFSTLVAVILVLTCLLATAVSAQTYKVLYSFTGGADGSTRFFGLLLDAAGDIYGTTSSGGSANGGVLFRIDPSGNETVIHNFKSQTGSIPNSTLLADGMGNVYGVAGSGGAGSRGVLYRLSLATGAYTVVYAFEGGADGGDPTGNLVKDGSGHLYGTTWTGGSGRRCGVVYQMDAAGNETVLHEFLSSDGSNPNWLYRDPTTGVLYGTTQYGGNHGGGVLFRITP